MYDLQWNCSFHSLSQLGCLWHRGSRDLGQLSLAHSGSNKDFTWFQFSSTHTVWDHRTFGIQSPVSAIGSDNRKKPNIPLGRQQQIGDKEKTIRSMKVFSLPKVKKQGEAADAMRASWRSRWRTGVCLWCQGKVCKDSCVSWCCEGEGQSSALVYTISACVYEGY